MRIIYTLIFTILLSALHAQESFLKYYDFKSEYGHLHGMHRVGDELIGTGIFWDTFISPNKLNIVVYKSNLDGGSLKYSYYRDVDSSAYTRIIIGPLYFQNILSLDDSSYVFCFYNLKKNYLEIFKFNKEFNLLNNNKVVSNNNPGSVAPSRIMLLNNNIYLSCDKNISTNQYKSYLFKFDKNLNLIWQKEIPSVEIVRSFEYDNISNEFVFSQYDGVDKITVTDTLLNLKRQIIKNESKKDVLWLNMKSVGDKGILTSNVDIIGNDQSGYSVLKSIVHYNKELNKVWKFSMGGLPDLTSEVVSIISSSDDAYFAYGQVGARVADVRDIYPTLDSIDIMILSTVKFKDDGKILWQRFDTLEQHYYYNDSYVECGGMVASDDGGIYVSGRVKWFDTIRINGEIKRKAIYRHFLMKIDSNGCVEGLHCNVEPKTETVLSVTPGLTAADDRLRIYPNPGTGRITVTRDEHTRSGLLTVYDAQGQPLISRKVSPGSEEIQLDLTGRSPGRYYVTVRQEDGKIVTGSFILVR